MGVLKRNWRLLKQAGFAKKRKNILGPYARAVLYATKNGSFLAPVDDIEIGSKIGKEGGYDLNELNQILHLVDAPSVVYVIGTHIGLLLVPIARKARSVIGYEANPNTFELLQMNIVLNQLNNTIVFNYAAGDKEGDIEFYMNVANSGGSKIKPKTDNFIYTFDKPETTKVKMKALDEHIATENLPPADMIVMDIEGAEYFALKGMQKALASSSGLYIEFIPHHLQNVAGVSATQLFDLIIPHYNKAKFMKQPGKVYDIKNNLLPFTTTIENMMHHQKDDNILFFKD
jgi:FkbM family methyltransferase